MGTHIDSFIENAEQVVQLLNLHAEKNKGKKTHHEYEILIKSAVVLFVACWEAFLEDLAENAVEFLVNNCDKPTKLPKPLLKYISEELKKENNELKIWALAENGWRVVVKDHYRLMLSKHLGPFNTPRAGNIDNLFKTILGLEHISSCWHWKGMSNKSAKEKLSDIITLRGAIAHRVKTSKKATYSAADSYGVHLIGLARQTHNKVREHIYAVSGKYPWSAV